jgi:hypothetical protein
MIASICPISYYPCTFKEKSTLIVVRALPVFQVLAATLRMSREDPAEFHDIGNGSHLAGAFGKPLPRIASRATVPLDLKDDESLLDRATKSISNRSQQYKQTTAGYRWFDWLAYFIPCLRWLKTYNVRAWLITDLVAGLSVGAMVRNIKEARKLFGFIFNPDPLQI